MRTAICCIALLGLSSNSVAATYTVNTSSDLASDSCTGGGCSLRGALLAANADSELDTIAFNIAPSDPGFQAATQHWRISVGASALPSLEAPVVIDGYSQPGAIANTNTPAQGGLNGVLKIEIQRGLGFGQDGLSFGNNFSQAPSTFRGLVINGFQVQIRLGGGSAHRIEGCYIGTDVLGQTALAGSVGIVVGQIGGYQIGGVLPAQRNLIASRQSSAISGFSESNGLVIQGNLIGLNRQGTAALANLGPGGATALSFSSPLRNARIGGSDPNARNVISGNPFGAIALFTSNEPTGYSGTRIEGNFIGTDVSGIFEIGNGNASSPQPSIQISGAFCALSIGGNAAGQANLIAFSADAGILANTCVGLQTPFNRFFGNRGEDFDLSLSNVSLGPTPNDPNDADEGANRFQNYPEITLPPVGSNLLSYRVTSAVANASYPITVNFYRAGCGGGSDALLTSTTISAAQAQLPQLLDVSALGVYLPLTATAVDAAGNTSEFAPFLGDLLFRTGFETLMVGTCF